MVAGSGVEGGRRDAADGESVDKHQEKSQLDFVYAERKAVIAEGRIRLARRLAVCL